MSRLRHMKARSLLILVAALAITSLGISMVVAANPFTDVPGGAYYADDVDAIYNAGITAGCTPTKYCPNAYVKRGDMAVFLNKVGAIGAGTTPVATAAKLGGREAKHLDGFQLDLVNDDAFHAIIDDDITVPQQCRLFMSGRLSAFTYNFTDYRRLVVDFFVDDVAVGMVTTDDNDPITSTFAAVPVLGFTTVPAGVHNVSIRAKITSGTNILKIYDPGFFAVCV